MSVSRSARIPRSLLVARRPRRRAAARVRQEGNPARREAAGGGLRDHGRAARHAGGLRVRRADPELAPGQHPGARQRLPRQARLHRGLDREGRAGALPDGQEAVPGAGRRRAGAGLEGPGRARRGEVEPRAREAAHGEGGAVAEGPGRRDRQLRERVGLAGGREGPARRPRSSISPTAPSPRRLPASAAPRRRPTAPTSTSRTASSRPSRCSRRCG